jgi:zinc protease
VGLSAVLAGQGGRLFTELRDKMSLCYTVSPTSLEGVDGGYFGFYIATSPDKEKTALEALRREIHRLILDGVTEKEWAHSRSFYIGNHEIEQQRFASQSIGIAMDELYGLGFKDYYNFEKHMASLKASDLNRVARKYLDGEARLPQVLAVVSPR